MYSIYRLKVDELDDNFVDSLKSLFKGKEVEIMVTPAEDQNLNHSEEEKVVAPRSVLQAIEEEDIKRFV